ASGIEPKPFPESRNWKPGDDLSAHHPFFRILLGHARGSLMEIETQVLISQKLGYLNSDQSNMLLNRATEVGKVLNGLLNSLRQK
ncbi:MAG: four helix bundle protein, partial [Candidatus Sulfotelmatobacter sp.]